jgi:DNA-binding beta-propeller fold protein YncE
LRHAPRIVLVLLACLLAAAPRASTVTRAAGAIGGAKLPYLPGSVLPTRPEGFTAGTTTILDDPAGRESTVIAAGPHGLAMRRFAFAAPPDPRLPFIAVACYDDGIVLHDASPPFAARDVLGIDGAPGDVAIDANGRLATMSTDNTSATIASLEPWSVRRYGDVPFGDALAFDRATGALFVTNRDIDGKGALTRVAADGTVTHRTLGLTAEGLAVDTARGLVYVANTNDGTVSIVDAASMIERKRFRAVDRVFAFALTPDGRTLYAVSNQSVESPFAAPGSVVAIDVASGAPHVVSRSAPMSFPVGIALDAARNRLYVTDEGADLIYVLDARTLGTLHAPLRTCETPWQPALAGGTLFVPCAQSDAVDAFDTSSLRRIAGAPFATGGYPLSVAVWQGKSRV